MTTEEKAKAYDEAIEKINGCSTDKYGCLLGIKPSDIFPQFSESGDERIRKWLIEMVEELRKANPTNAEHNGNCSDAIAYLEKQKEQKPLSTEETELNSIAFLEQMGYTCIPPGKEQSTEWSDEDEKTIDEAVGCIENYAEYVQGEFSKQFVLGVARRVDSLRPQPHWKPSEEQMEALKHCVNGWQDNADGRLESLYNDLKKL